MACVIRHLSPLDLSDLTFIEGYKPALQVVLIHSRPVVTSTKVGERWWQQANISILGDKLLLLIELTHPFSIHGRLL
jgi:hypothetical protein